MEIVVCVGGVTSAGGTVVNVVMRVVVTCGIGGLPIGGRGCEERPFPGDWAPGVLCGVQCGVEVVCIGKLLLISPPSVVKGGRERPVEHIGRSGVIGR